MYIVTGGAGFIGSAIVAKLNSEGINDLIIVDHLGSKAKWKNLVGKRYRDYINKDHFLEMMRSNRLPGGLDAIIHMGACSSTIEADSDYMMENNYRYTKLLAQRALEHDVRFIYASSGATYGAGELGYSDEEQLLPKLKPLNVYGYSKHAFDLWAFEERLFSQFAGLKFFNVFGPNEYHKDFMTSFVFKAYHQIQNTGEVNLYRSYNPNYLDGESVRDFVYVNDCTNVIWWLLENPKTNGIFNVGSGKARSWRDLTNATFIALGKNPKIDFIDMPEVMRGQYQYHTEADLTKLRAAGYNIPMLALEDGVKDYVQNYLAPGLVHM